MSRRNGGIVGPVNTPVGGLITGSASGVWRMNDVLTFVNNSQWPKVPENIENACRFDDGSNDNLERAQVDGDKKTWTTSWWVKRANLGINTTMWDAGTSGGNNYSPFFFQSDDTIRFYEVVGGSLQSFNFITNRVFRDTSAWYHIVYRVDTTQSTEADRVRLYINGVQETSFSTSAYPAQDYNTTKNNSSYRNTIGTAADNDGNDLDAYLAEFVHVDGQSLEPTSFGEFDSTTGIWKPKKIGQIANAGSNSFYLDFKDSSNLGNDASGLNNDFTVNNLTSIDQSTDTCVVNFATWNPNLAMNSTMATADGNLEGLTGSNYASGASNSWFTSLGMSAGKFYCEIKMTYASANQGEIVGVGYDLSKHQQGTNVNAYNLGYIAEGWSYLGAEGNIKNNNSTVLGSMPTWGTNDIVGIAIDVDNYKLYFSVNGTFINSGDPTSGSTGTGAVSLTTGKTYYFACSDASLSNTHKYQLNCGSPAFSISSGNSDANGFGNFEYSVPSGYYALNTTNLNTYG